MGRLLMVESWVGAMSTLLPRAIGEAGHGFTFLTRDLGHYLRSRQGGETHPLLGAENVLTAETNDLPELLERAERLQEVFGFDGVLTSCDYYLPAVAHLARRLGLPGAAPEAVERACRKDLARRALTEAGVAGPRYAVTRDWPETLEAAGELGFPLVIKPVDLCAGMYVRKVSSEAELREAFLALEGFPVNARGQARSPLVLLEELLHGPEVSVETVTFEGDTRVVGVTDKSLAGEPWFVESGHMFPARLAPEAAEGAAALAVAALEALGFDHGVAHTEIRLTPDGPRLVEVNPRPAGNRITELVRRVTGIDLALAHARLALGERPDTRPVDTGVRSAAVVFLVPGRTGRIASIDGVPDVPEAVDVEVRPVGHRVGDTTSNNGYLGHVLVVDTAGDGALARAEELAAGIRVEYAA
ncbi:ATP-grasp domain-containing protein [Actinocorallia sp. B10E7]|uniref:ATP-grasp domain-containing protein n=1 Tax=Actinocorallia sp. B10E7 TaxID=3153558 RepID=UPI00325DF380